jgi:hypothetical protein
MPAARRMRAVFIVCIPWVMEVRVATVSVLGYDRVRNKVIPLDNAPIECCKCPCCNPGIQHSNGPALPAAGKVCPHVVCIHHVQIPLVMGIIFNNAVVEHGIMRIIIHLSLNFFLALPSAGLIQQRRRSEYTVLLYPCDIIRWHL